jgi:hypothetical protein
VKTATIRLCDLKFLATLAKKAAEDEAMGYGDESQATSERKHKMSERHKLRIKRIQVRAQIRTVMADLE